MIIPTRMGQERICHRYCFYDLVYTSGRNHWLSRLRCGNLSMVRKIGGNKFKIVKCITH
jgi:hypothetical protein